MTEKLDATSRLADGRPSVEVIQSYVSACHQLGYQNPDLTLHAAQLHDTYASEDGLDLWALDADCSAFERVVAATEEALTRQGDQLGAMSGAWAGHGAQASREFLRRHGDASAAATAAVRTVAEALAALRDSLWDTVDGKVSTALAIEDRRSAQRAEWLAAAQTVMSGAGDRSVASELIDQQVKPFVDNDIRSDWVSAMRAATTAVADAFDAATAELRAEPRAQFDVPADLGPSWTPQPRDDEARTTPAAAASPPGLIASAPSSWTAPPTTAPPPLMPSAPLVPAPHVPALSPPVAPVESTAPTMAAPPTMPSMGSGMPDIGSGLSGFGQQLADTLGGLLGSSDDALPDAPELDEELDDEPDDEPEESAEPEEAEPIEEADLEEEPAAETADTCAEQPVEETPAEPLVEPPPPSPQSEPTPTPAPLPPPAEPALPPEPVASGETPCEIAANELPQVGE